ncbi:putative lipid II flippase FtsW [Terriglobus saanensis]|uniref:Probable peptidoglycan glycosyltransferase FtsW n=1 Tax=Terriglobus saanensis (strain ATCC BAA-1853 / DSM 23119 / SP1PR4) TaxID=401053 RepID=E8V7Q1_TERSS|nr:putative lipid II flippase FtsW [Terriglobus saanensis]ADV81749.1 cell division protein FtsW [Terriglobus saanensis SP1PR4]
MAKRVGVDKWLFGTVLLLVLFGLVMVFSASAVMAKSMFGSPYFFVTRQAIWASLGLVAMVLLMKVDYRLYNNPKVVFPAVGITALCLTVVFAMRDSHNTHRWIKFGGASFQPSELAKPVLVLFLAYFLQTRIHQMEDWKGTILRAAAPPLFFIALILKEPDLGTAMVCAGVLVLMLYLAGAQTRYFLIGFAGAAPVLYYLLFHVAWRRARMLAFVNPEADPRGSGFHILQSLIAVGTGGVYGHGLMEGIQKLFYLPEPHTDFIFANVCEELGLIGALFVVALFCMLGYRGLRTAFLTTDPFARFMAFGLTTAILIQAFFNISVVLALLPTKGIPLPFISNGGTSVFITLAGMGVLLNISREID